MTRLFVAIDLSFSVRAELIRIQPAPTAGLRLVSAAQMHLTLHFIGDAQVDPLVKALNSVAGSPLTMVIERVGKFPPGEKANVLWAGVRGDPELIELQAAMGTALAAAGFHVEARPYSPHITLARCGHRVPAEVVDEFLVQHQAFALPPLAVSGFGLYSSTTVDGAPVYRREGWFPFQA